MAEDEPEKVIADPNSEQNPDAKRTLQDDLTLGILQILQPAVEEIDSKVLNVRYEDKNFVNRPGLVNCRPRAGLDLGLPVLEVGMT